METKFTLDAIHHKEVGVSDEEVINYPSPYSDKELKRINKLLLDKFGFESTTGRQRFRLIWPNSPAGLIFACDEWHVKYLGARKHYKETEGYLVISKKNTAKRYYVSAKKSRGLINGLERDKKAGKESDIFIIPKIRDEVIEIHVPRLVVERIATPPELVGQNIPDSELETTWEENRWLYKTEPMAQALGIERDVDVLGPFPFNGEYVAFMYIEDQVMKKDLAIGTSFRLFNEDKDLIDIALEWDKFNEWKAKSLDEKRQIKEKSSDKKLSDDISDSISEVTEEITNKLLGKKTFGYKPDNSKIIPLLPVDDRARETARNILGVNK